MAYLAYYPFTAQAPYDYSGNDLTGTVASAAYVSSRMLGFSDALRITIASGSKFTTGYQAGSAIDISYTLVLMPGNGSGYLIGQHSGANGLAIEQTQRGTVRIAVNGASSATVDIDPAAGHVLTLTYSAGTSILYVDGVASAIGSYAGTPTIPAQPVAVGDGTVGLDVIAIHIHDSEVEPAGVFGLAGAPSGPMPTPPLDSASWTPADFTSPIFKAWVDPSDSAVVTLSGSDVVSITDKSPAQLGEMTAETTLMTISAAAINGHDVLVPNGRHLSLPILPLTSPWVIWLQNHSDAVVSITGADTANWVLCAENGTTGAIVIASGTPTFRMDGIAQAWANRGDAYASFGGVTRIVGIEGFDTSAWTHFEIFGYSTVGSTWRLQTPGQMGEIFVFDSEPAANVREAFEGYLAHKYGITANLDVGHPFKTLQPTLGDAIGNPLSFSLAGGLSSVSRKVAAYKEVNKHQSFMPGVRGQTDAYLQGDWTEVGMRDSNYRAPIALHNYRDGSASSLRIGDAGVPRKENQGRIYGTVLDDASNPISRLVRCMNNGTGNLVAERWSAQDGTYEFKDLELTGTYTIVAMDYTGTFNAVIASSVIPDAY